MELNYFCGEDGIGQQIPIPVLFAACHSVFNLGPDAQSPQRNIFDYKTKLMTVLSKNNRPCFEGT